LRSGHCDAEERLDPESAIWLIGGFANNRFVAGQIRAMVSGVSVRRDLFPHEAMALTVSSLRCSSAT
jgi:hypothetical protein